MQGPFIWIALDGLATNESAQLSLASLLDQIPGEFGWKLPLDWLLRRGLTGVRKVRPLGNRPCFADLKIWNGARTMTQIFLECHHAGMDIVNAHALAGGSPGAGDELRKAILTFRGEVESPMRIYANTILTHYNDEYCQRHFVCAMEQAVAQLVLEGVHAGADGTILPGTMLRLANGVPSIVPGVRTKRYHDKRHVHEISPETTAGRTDVQLVVGGPVTKVDDPIGALKEIMTATRK